MAHKGVGPITELAVVGTALPACPDSAGYRFAGSHGGRGGKPYKFVPDLHASLCRAGHCARQNHAVTGRVLSSYFIINVPLLFFAGTRDPLCDLELLKKVLACLKVARELEVIDGGDHSFNMLKSADIAPQQVHDRIIQKMATWLKANLL